VVIKRHELLQALQPIGCSCFVLVALSGACWPFVIASLKPVWLVITLKYTLLGALLLLCTLTFKRAKQLLTIAKETKSTEDIPRSVVTLCVQLEVLLSLVACLAVGLIILFSYRYGDSNSKVITDSVGDKTTMTLRG
jgi:hypothetical protein